MLQLLLTIYVLVYYQEQLAASDTNYDVRFWIEIEVMSFYHIILMSIAFLVLSTFLQAKLPDPKNLLKSYDYLELVVAETMGSKLTQAIMLETFPGIMFIFTMIN
jgi:hypothetical protein